MSLGEQSQDGKKKQQLRTEGHCGVDINNIYISTGAVRLSNIQGLNSPKLLAVLFTIVW